MDSPHKGPVTRKRFPFDDVILSSVFVPLELPLEFWIELVTLEFLVVKVIFSIGIFYMGVVVALPNVNATFYALGLFHQEL